MVSEKRWKKLFAKGNRFTRTNHQCGTKAAKWGYDAGAKETLMRPAVEIGEPLEVMVVNHMAGDVIFKMPWGEFSHLSFPKNKQMDVVAKKGTIEISNAQGILLTYKPI